MSTKYINKQSHASTLAFRLAFGDVVEFNSFCEFWVDDPQFHFTYYGFQWDLWEIIPIYFYYSCVAALLR
jgi:hypothetical protein